MNLVHRLRAKYSEPYRIRNGYGLSPIRNKRELRALVAFCEEQLKEEYMKLNPDRREVFELTVKLANPDCFYVYYKQEKYINIYRFIEDRCGWYWS